MSVRPSDYLKNKKRICMNLLPAVCHGPRISQLNFGNIQDPDYQSIILLMFAVSDSLL